ncbi:MAG: DUF4126 domain-containing protein [Bowdeniella nasicola]|nr:DUF4126 domain-containing protein [Bowdeniella nasicola]
MDLVSAFGLGSAAGLNAYVPMLALGLLARFTDAVTLPPEWSWLTDTWLLTIVGVLALVEFIADKVPAVDSINDTIQSLVRPASGGIVFASALGSDPQVATDSATAFSGGRWVLFAVGAVVALIVHLMKSTARPVANVSSAGLAAPVLSLGEDVTSVALSLMAIFAPIIALVLVVAAVGFFIWLLRRGARLAPDRRQDRGAA